LHDLAKELASHPTEQALTRVQLILAHIRIVQAIKNVQDAEQSIGLSGHMTDVTAPFDAAA
jgi:hypothetical protein